MAKYAASKLVQAIVVLFIVGFATFMLLSYMPGDMATAMAGDATPEQVIAMRAEMGLDRPISVQFLEWLGKAVRGDFGYSYYYNDSVIHVIMKPLERTMILGVLSLLVSFAVGIFLGVISGVYRGKWLDDLISVTANTGIAAPQFWIGIILIYVLAMNEGIFPIEGYVDPYKDFGGFVRCSVLPVATLAIPSVASIARQARSAVLETIGQDYVRTARAKGLKKITILTKHVLKNALMPVVTLLGLRVRLVFGGSVIVEEIFNINGMGRVMSKAITMQDTNMAQCCVLIIGIVVIVSTLLVDLLYGVLDPRIRDRKGA